jgi:hypothetical protein
MERTDRDAPPPGLPALDDDAPLDEGYDQGDHYGHNQDFTELRDPRRFADTPPGEPLRPIESAPAAPRKRPRPHPGGLATGGAGGIPDDKGHSHTGFGDVDRD